MIDSGNLPISKKTDGQSPQIFDLQKIPAKDHKYRKLNELYFFSYISLNIFQAYLVVSPHILNLVVFYMHNDMRILRKENEKKSGLMIYFYNMDVILNKLSQLFYRQF